MRLRNFKKALETAIAKIGEIPEDSELFVMISEDESDEVKGYLEQLGIKHNMFPRNVVAKNDIKFTFIKKNAPNVGYLRQSLKIQEQSKKA